MRCSILGKRYIDELHCEQYKIESEDKNIFYLTSKELKKHVANKEIELKNYSIDSHGRLIKLYDEDLTNKRFGNWLVLGYAGKSKWRCQCQCDSKTISEVPTSSLKSGKSLGCKACMHTRTKASKADIVDSRDNTFKDLTNSTFGLWKALEYVGNGMWKCQCQCESKTIRTIYGGSLRAGRTTSCGCNKNNRRISTLQSKYGEISTKRLDTPREKWQLDILESKQNLLEYIKELGYKPTITELSQNLNVTYSTIHRLIDNDLVNYISINDFSSSKEDELYSYIRELLPDKEILRNNRSIIHPYELDIYIPDLRIAFEFNGNYWHSTVNKTKYYHQDKSIASLNKGIQLIHIFEYEWDNKQTQSKLKNYIKDLVTNIDIIYARKTVIEEKTSSEVRDFLEENHLQGKINSSINITLTYNDKIVGALTIGKPRFNKNYDYEIHRLCFKHGTRVVGGFSKMLKYFIDKYASKGTKIISYTDISKFNGKSYVSIGFNENCVTEPNYIWFNPVDKSVLHRYDAQKHMLIEKGLGDKEDTEDKIMERLGYLKIYDSGNVKLEYIVRG